MEAPCLLGSKSCELLITRKAHTDEVTSLLGQTARSCLMASSPNFPRASLRIGLVMCPFIFLDFSVCVCGGEQRDTLHFKFEAQGKAGGGSIAPPAMAKSGPLCPTNPQAAPMASFPSPTVKSINCDMLRGREQIPKENWPSWGWWQGPSAFSGQGRSFGGDFT